MDILIISQFCGDFNNSDNGRFKYITDILSVYNEVEIITSSFRHTTKRQRDTFKGHLPYKITFIHEPGYKKNISIQRFFSHHSWGIEVQKYLNQRKKPDVIYCAVPSLTAPLRAAKYCEKNNIRFIIDIQDLWPEAFKLAVNIPVVSDIVFCPFNVIANSIYKRADEICAVSDTYTNRALKVNTKCKNGHTVFLGTKISTFDEYATNYAVDKPKDEMWLGYCGTLGASYDITIAIDALSILKKRNVFIPRFIVLGDGERKSEFEQYAKKLGVECTFTGRLPYEQMCGWLAKCDFAVNPIMHNAAQSIINKHGDYAASGIPVLNTQECKEYRDLVEEYKMGFNCENGDAKGLADKLQLLIEDKNLRYEIGKNARRCAEEKFDRKNSYQELLTVFE